MSTRSRKSAKPAPAGGVEEDDLVDNVGPGSHGRERVSGGAVEIPGAAPKLDRGDALTARAQRSEVVSLVLIALASDELALRIVERRPYELAASNREIERGQMLALEEVVQIGRREDEISVAMLHTPIVTCRPRRWVS